MHDVPDPALGKAIPDGIDDLTGSAVWVSVGINHDTVAFAVETLRRWWLQMIRDAYPDASRLLITAEGGGAAGCGTAHVKNSQISKA